jgi:hypothetical protein
METKKYRIIKKEYQDGTIKFTAERYDSYKNDFVSIYTNPDLDNVRNVIKEREANDLKHLLVKEEVIE